MSDIAIHVEVDDGKPEKVTVPSDMKASEFLNELVEGLHLPSSNGNGRGLQWTLIDKATGHALEPERTLDENGVRIGQSLILRVVEPKSATAVVICEHCGLENEPGNKFCRKCGKRMRRGKAPDDLRFQFHTEDGKEDEVEVPGGLTAIELITDLRGAAAKGDEWTLYDKDTGADLDLAKSLAENGVRSGHHVYLRKLPPPNEITKKTSENVIEKEKKPWPTRTVLGVLLVVVALAGAAVVAKMIISGRPSSVRVAISPTTADLKISERQQFTATVGGVPGAVRWSIVPPLGNVDSTGLYTAPHSVSTQTAVTVTATSVDSPKQSANGQITLEAGREVVELTPENATLMAGESAAFSANVRGTSNAQVRWSIKPEIGTIDADGRYTAPSPVAEDAVVNVTATSVEDANESATASIALKPVSIELNPKSATVLAATYFHFEAILRGTSNRGVRWSITGPGTISKNGVYFAPHDVSDQRTVQVTAVSSADPTKSASAALRLQPVIALSVSPENSSMGAGQRERLSVSVTGTTNNAVRWTLSGPGSLSPDGVYQSPDAVSEEETAHITAISGADPSKRATATVTLRPLSVSVSPASADLGASQTRKFSAVVLGSNNTGVRWTLTGRGTLNQEGLYTAPIVVIADQIARITATSVADPSRSATAIVTLKRYSGPMIGTLIWSGSLARNGTVTIDDSGPSLGTVQGSMLPGLPVLITLDNNRDYGLSEPPSIRNGFRRLTITSRRGRGNGVKITWTVVLNAQVKP
jgi:ribosomal protein L40E